MKKTSFYSKMEKVTQYGKICIAAASKHRPGIQAGAKANFLRATRRRRFSEPDLGKDCDV